MAAMTLIPRFDDMAAHRLVIDAEQRANPFRRAASESETEHLRFEVQAPQLFHLLGRLRPGSVLAVGLDVVVAVEPPGIQAQVVDVVGIHPHTRSMTVAMP